MGWQEDALAEIDCLSRKLIERHDWCPSLFRTDDHIDLYCTMKRGLGDRHVLRLRYKADWQTAGRREQFVDPENYGAEGADWWPVGVTGINPQNNPPALCLVGFWGFHSAMHSSDGRSPLERNLGWMLQELQTVMRNAQ